MGIIRTVLPPFLALTLVVSSAATQAVPRTDTPRAGTLRVTFEPVITTWEREFTDSSRQRRVGATLPTTVFVRAGRRVTPLGLDFGITNRIAVGVRVPLVRVNTRESFPQDSAGNPADSAGKASLDTLLRDTTYAFDTISGSTPRHLRYFAGDIELEAKYRLLESHSYSLSGAFV
ncbi:MAG: hypothetical protein ACREMI_06070, partial [Gemmatimonadales bacterium]